MARGPLPGFRDFYPTEFSERAYPAIPDQFGGGRPATAQLLLKPEGVAPARAVGLRTAGDSKLLSEPVKVLVDGGTILVLELPSGDKVQLDMVLETGGVLVGEKIDIELEVQAVKAKAAVAA